MEKNGDGTTSTKTRGGDSIIRRPASDDWF